MAADFLDRSHSVARAGFSRWLVPPAALCIHLAIGQAYAFSVFTKPMAQLIGLTAPEFLQKRHGLPSAPFTEVIGLFNALVNAE